MKAFWIRFGVGFLIGLCLSGVLLALGIAILFL